MRKPGVLVEEVRAVDHEIATGLQPDMAAHGAETDEWPMVFQKTLDADKPGPRGANLARRQQLGEETSHRTAGEGASYITGQLITVDGANSISEERGR